LVSHFLYLADNTDIYVIVFSKEDGVLIEQLHLFKGCGAKKRVTQFPEKVASLQCEPLTEKIKRNGHYRPSGRQREAEKFEDTGECRHCERSCPESAGRSWHSPIGALDYTGDWNSHVVHCPHHPP